MLFCSLSQGLCHQTVMTTVTVGTVVTTVTVVTVVTIVTVVTVVTVLNHICEQPVICKYHKGMGDPNMSSMLRLEYVVRGVKKEQVGQTKRTKLPI